MTARGGGDSSRSGVLAALRPFPGQQRRAHLAVVLVGVAAWSTAFLAALALLGGEGVATADTAAAREARTLAGTFASVAGGLYFGVAFTRERGGPVANLLYAPLSAAVGATGAPIAVAYGATPEGVFAAPARAGSPLGGVGELAVFATATLAAVAVVAVHYAVVAGPAERARIESWFTALPGVHAGPHPFEDWRRADGGFDDGDPDQHEGGDPEAETGTRRRGGDR